MPPLERRPLAAAIALLFSSISPVAAQSVPDATAQQANEPSLPEVKVKAAPEEPGFRTDVIRTGTRTETPLRDIPQIINVVPQSLIRSQNATTLQDALRNVPGISYARGRGRHASESSVLSARLSVESGHLHRRACVIWVSTTAICSPRKRSRS